MHQYDIALIINDFMYMFKNIIETNSRGLFLGITVATLIYIIRKNEILRRVLDAIVFKDKNLKVLRKIKFTMKYYNVDFEEAKKLIISEEIKKSLKISKPSWFLRDDRLVYKGHRISFYDKEIGNIVGEFIGIINSDLDGYDDLYVVKIAKDNSIRQAPISFVDEDTLQIYE